MIIAAPTEHHYWLGMESLEAGRHVLMEKPLARSQAEAEALARTARGRGLALQVGHVERFNPAFQEAASRIRQPRYIEAARTSSYSFRSTDIGVVLDLMIHDLDLVLSLVGSPVQKVEAVGSVVMGPHEDIAYARLWFENGCIASLHASRVSFNNERKMQLLSEQVSAEIDFANSAVRIAPLKPRSPYDELNIGLLTPEQKLQLRDRFFEEVLPLEKIELEKRNAILDEQNDFVISIRSGESPQVTGEHGRQALEAAEQIIEQIAGRTNSLNVYKAA